MWETPRHGVPDRDRPTSLRFSETGAERGSSWSGLPEPEQLPCCGASLCSLPGWVISRASKPHASKEDFLNTALVTEVTRQKISPPLTGCFSGQKARGEFLYRCKRQQASRQGILSMTSAMASYRCTGAPPRRRCRRRASLFDQPFR